MRAVTRARSTGFRMAIEEGWTKTSGLGAGSIPNDDFYAALNSARDYDPAVGTGYAWLDDKFRQFLEYGCSNIKYTFPARNGMYALRMMMPARDTRLMVVVDDAPPAYRSALGHILGMIHGGWRGSTNLPYFKDADVV
ncbi:MAG: hypothetical protein MPK62_00470 [Alphaproteobacteria bacterium]|nr:hypothetical protein [Alphaproteobacteria bacterium]